MTSWRPTHTSACRTAEALLRKIVMGEASPEEREEFAAHLATCRSCATTLGKTLKLTGAVRATLGHAASRFSHTPPVLELPERSSPHTWRSSPFRVLVDFSVLTVMGMGMVFLITFAWLSYRALSRASEDVKRFTACQEVLYLTHVASRVRDRAPDLPSGQFQRRLLETLAEHPIAGCAPNFRDPWDTLYHVVVDKQGVTIWSSGPDRVNNHGNGDDITTGSEPPSLGHPPQRP